ncbi:MAG: hypothetical protein KQI35_07455 [Bacteroidetes bacterium]|nr:hypothetical protein [Bacteroidota bacterium]
MQFKGEVLKIKKNKVKFLVEDLEYTIPSSDIFGIYFDKEPNPVYRELMGYANGDELTDPEKCMKAQMDVKAFHGKEFGNFALGFFFGIIGVIGCAVSSPGPQNGADTYMLSENKELFNDPAYLACYKKKARSKSVGDAAIGWVASILLLVAIIGS